MRARFAIIAAGATVCLISAALAQGDPYPAHSVRLVVSSLPGGNPDVLGRLLADRMTADFGKAIIVENVTGAGGAMSAATVAKAPPDGYTLLFGDTGIMGIGPLIKPDIGFDPIKDFTPVTGLVALPTILVADPKVPASTLSEFVALAKREPGKINYGSAGVGSIHHMTMAIFADQIGIDVVHVPYRAGTAMVNGLLTGEIQAAWSGIPNVQALIEDGRLHGYCISVLTRSASTPAIPTCDELGIKGFDVATVMGLYVPAGTSLKIVARLQAEVAKVMREPAMAARMEQLGMIMKEDGTANYAAFIKRDIDRYSAIVHKLNLQTR
ncbi:MAG TPA: tripartite tricarboxylate transporter substrate binding protein [Xanthobacteraceae bacterium]|nr:tripartite tricarboxylate transporter substrate binding protein [Xanthobacteraceae bacterium]